MATPHTFTAGGCCFVVQFNAATVARVKEYAGLDLPRMVGRPKRLARIFDQRTFGYVLAALVEGQAPASWTPRQFARAMLGAVPPAPDAVCEALREWHDRQRSRR